MAKQEKVKFTIVVGSTSKPLGLTPRDEAIEYARSEYLKGVGVGVSVTLLEQTADRGAVSILFMEI